MMCRLLRLQTELLPDVTELLAVTRALPHVQTAAATSSGAARAAAVGVGYSEPSSRRRRPFSVTVANQRSPLRGRSHTRRSPGTRRPASITCRIVTRREL